nr:hypothetical protein [Tanacetum cinerariifolium]
MGYEKPFEKLTFYKDFFSPQWKFLIPTILQCLSAKTTSWNEFSSTMASAIICLANNQKFNFSKYILTSLVKNLDAGVPFYMFHRFIQVFVNHQLGDMSHHKALEEVGDLPTDVQDTHIPDDSSSSQPQRKHKPRRKQRMETQVSPTETNTKEHVPIPSNDLLPSGKDRMQLKELMELCTNLSNKVLDLESKVIDMKSSHKSKIKELESRVEKLKKENRSLTKELKSFNTRVESLNINETVVDKEESSKHRRKIADIDADPEVNLENVYNLDMTHEETVLSMQDVNVQSERIDSGVKEVAEEIVEVMEIAKIIVDEVSTTRGELNAANEEPISAAPINITTAQPIAQARKNMMIYLKNMAGYKMNYFKGMSYEQIRPLFEMEYKKVQAYLNKGLEMDAERIKAPRKRTRKEKVKKDQPAKKQKGDELEQNNAKKQKLEEQEDAKELKKNLEIVPDDEDDVFVNVTPLSSKPPTIVDYKIYKERKKEHFQIFKANGNHQMLKFNREDLEVLWKIVKPSLRSHNQRKS